MGVVEECWKNLELGMEPLLVKAAYCCRKACDLAIACLAANIDSIAPIREFTELVRANSDFCLDIIFLFFNM
jgi:hypothetical protein